MTTATATAPETMSTDQPTDQRQTVGTLKPADLIAALDAVIPHADAKGNLPILQSVKLEAADDVLTLATTDRYTIGTYTLEWDGPEVDALLTLADAKELQRFAKGTTKHLRELPCLTLQFGDSLEAATFETRRTFPLRDVAGFPRWRAVMPDYAAEEDRGVSFIGINPVHLVKFSKAGERNAPLRFTFGRSPVKPILVTCGDHFRGVIMPVRMPD